MKTISTIANTLSVGKLGTSPSTIFPPAGTAAVGCSRSQMDAPRFIAGKTHARSSRSAECRLRHCPASAARTGVISISSPRRISVQTLRITGKARYSQAARRTRSAKCARSILQVGAASLQPFDELPPLPGVPLTPSLLPLLIVIILLISKNLSRARLGARPCHYTQASSMPANALGRQGCRPDRQAGSLPYLPAKVHGPNSHRCRQDTFRPQIGQMAQCRLLNYEEIRLGMAGAEQRPA